MPFDDDIRRLAKAHSRALGALERPDQKLRQKIFKPTSKSPGRAAATILCEELRWIVKNEVFWRRLQGGICKLQKNNPEVPVIFNKIEELLADEERALERLRIDPATTSEVLAYTYDALEVLKTQPTPTPGAVQNLRDRVRRAADLICAAKDGPLQRAFGRLVSLKGLRIVGGLTVAGANVAWAYHDPSTGLIAWKSVKAGWAVVRGEADELIKILTDQQPPGGDV